MTNIDKLKNQLFDTIEKNESNLISDLSRLLQFKTISGTDSGYDYRNEFKDAFDFLEEISNRHNIKFQNIDNSLGIIDYGDGKDIIGALLHIDVVPVDDKWDYPAFGGDVVGNEVYGRGTLDNKGPLMSCLYGMVALSELNIKLKHKIRMIIGTTEEVGDWSEIRKYKENYEMPIFCFVPDAEFPIINGEKGMVNIKFSTSLDSGQRENNFDFEYVKIYGGQRANIIPGSCIIEIIDTKIKDNKEKGELEKVINKSTNKKKDFKCKYEFNNDKITIEIIGKSAHGSQPWNGINAITNAIDFLSQFKFAHSECNKFIMFLKDLCSDMYGEGLGIKSEHHFVGKTTSSLNVIKTTDTGIQATVNIRNTLGMPPEKVVELTTNVIEDFNINNQSKIKNEKVSAGSKALYVDPEDNKDFISSLQKAYNEVTNLEPELKAIGGTTYAKAFPNTVSFGPILPGEETLEHQANERVKIPVVLRNTKIYGYTMLLLGNPK